MTERTDEVKRIIESLDPEELRGLADYLRSKLPKHFLEEKWGISHSLILDAIARAQDITHRGVRGVIAEAVFAKDVIPTISLCEAVDLVGDHPFDFKMKKKGGREIKIQVKLQRTEDGRPLVRKIFGPDTYVVEVQKTRSGTKRQSRKSSTADAPPLKTRPYHFGDFDILAVNMQPSSGDWRRFMYTVGSWLMPRAQDKKQIEIMQPVAASRNGFWTDDINECIEWYLSGKRKCIFNMKQAKATLAAERAVARDARKSAKKAAKPPRVPRSQ